MLATPGVFTEAGGEEEEIGDADGAPVEAVSVEDTERSEAEGGASPLANELILEAKRSTMQESLSTGEEKAPFLSKAVKEKSMDTELSLYV
jgi:hypothetical protein